MTDQSVLIFLHKAAVGLAVSLAAVTIVTMIPAMLFAFSSAALSGLAALATVAGVVVLLRGLGDLRGTTLFAPWSWLLASVMAIGSVQVVAALSPAGASRDWFDALRYVAAVTTFCPMVAVLGAKRPQNRAWMFIVLTLLGVLALPALTALAVGRGDGIETHLARQWFAVALIVVAPLNYLLTRYAPATLVFAAAQVFLLAEHLPGGQSLVFTGSQAVGPILMLLAICLVTAGRRRHDVAKGYERMWIDFRNMYGSLWSLRVVERLNAEADSHDWPVRFSWIGMVRSDGDLSREIEMSAKTTAAVASTVRAVLSRFVSPSWIAERWGEVAEATDDGAV